MHLFTSATGEDHSGSFSLIHSDSHVANAILVPDAELLFTGTFHRSGLDLVLTGHDGRHHVIPGYFANEHPPALMAPSGAHLTPEVVDMLAGSPAPHEYAQAGAAQPAVAPDSIGKVQKVTGTVTVLRNGVSVAVNVGDVVYKSDVVVTGADSKCGITFPDGTALELLPNTRMALNEYNYDAHATSNQALFTLIDGTFGFVAGKVAHSGDMKIGTPVATMGIRGTTGVVQHVVKANVPAGTINATVGGETYSFSVYDDPGTTTAGWWDMYVQNSDGTEQLAATVSQTGYVTFFTLQGRGLPPLVTTVPLNASQVNADQVILQDLFETFALGGPRSLGIPGSGGNPLLQLPPNLFPDFFNGGGTPTYNFQLPGLPGLPGPQDPQGPSNPAASNIFIWPIGNGTWPTGPIWLGHVSPTEAIDIVIIESGIVTYDLNLTIFSLTINGPLQNGGLPLGELLMTGGGLAVTNGLDIFGTLFLDGDPPFFASYGPSTIYTGGKVIVTGAGAVAEFSPNLANPVTAPVVVHNFGKMVAKSGGDIEFIDATVKNEAANAANTGNTTGTSPAGRIAAVGDGAIVDFTNVTFDNAGIVVAKDTGESGGVFFGTSDVTNDAGARITAKDGGTITFALSTLSDPLGIDAKVDNFGLIDAKSGGQITFEVAVTNESDARIASSGRDSLISFTDNELDNFGVVRAAWDGTIKFVGEDIINEAANSSTTPTQPGGKIEAKDGGRIKILGGSVSNGSQDGGVGAVITAIDHGSIFFASTASNLLGVTNYDGAKITAVDCGTITFKDVGLFNNAGALIEAKDHGVVTVIETKNSTAGVMNAGTIKAADHGIVAFVDVGVGTSGGVINSIGATEGLIEAIGCGAKVELINSTIVGGTLQTRDGGVIEAVRGRSTFLNVLINGGIIAVDCHAALALKGDTVIDKTVTFEGPGVFELKGSDKITGGDAHALLKNDSTIAGSGTIGGNGLTLINESCGTILAIGGFGHPLTIDTGSNKIVNHGLLEAGWFSKLDIESKLDNSGRVVATHGGVVVANADVVNKHGALIEAEFGGKVTLDDIKVTNEFCAVIEAKGFFSTVSIDGSTVDNAGAIEAKWGGTVSIADSTINNECGLIAAYGFGAVVDLKNSTIYGGTLATGDPCSPCFGVIDITSPGRHHTNTVVFDGSGEAVTIDGFVKVDPGATLELVGAIVNDGTIDVDSPVAGADLAIDGTVVLSGDGVTTLEGSADEITGVADSNAKLENYSNIDGSGRIGIGDDALKLINEKGGHIVADGGVDTTLIVNTGANRIINDGVMEAVWFSELDIGSKLHNFGRVIATEGGEVVVEKDVVNEAGGRIVAKLGGLVTLDGIKVTNDGSGCDDTPGGVIVARGEGSAVSMSGDTVDNAGTIAARKGGLISISDSVVHNDGGEIESSGVCSVVMLADSKVIDGDISVTGKGNLDFEGASDTLKDVYVSVGDRGNIFVGETTDDGTLLKLTHGTVISGGTLTIAKGSEVDVESSQGAALDGVDVENHGTIQVDCDADETPIVPLILEGGTTIEGGLLSVGNHGVLDIEGYSGATLDNVTVDVGRRGHIEVMTTASGSILTLEDDTVVSGGTLIIDKGSELAVESHEGATLAGVDVVNHGIIQVDSGGDQKVVPLVLENGTKIAHGTLDVGSHGELDVESTSGATLKDVTVEIDKHGDIEIGESTTSGSILMLEDGTTIAGGTLTIACRSELAVESHAGATLDGVDVENHGTIQIDSCEDQTVVPLILNNGTSITGGTLDVGSKGMLDIESQSGATLDGVTVNVDGCGQIAIGEHTASGSVLMLDHDTVISGGKLTIASQSALDIETKAGATLDGVHVVDDGTINVDPGKAVLTLDDTKIDGEGTLNIGDDGTVDVTGDSTICVGVVNDGKLSVEGATLTVYGAVSGTGIDTIGNNGVLDFMSGVSADQTVKFADQTGTLDIGDAANFLGTIAGFVAGDTIDLVNLAFSSSFYALWDQAAGMLDIFSGGTLEDSIKLTGHYDAHAFALTSDSATGTDIVYATNDEWTDTAGGAWSVAGNWSQDAVPNALLNAVIDESGRYTVTTADTIVANSLTISDHHATLSGSGTIGILTIDNDGTIDAVSNSLLTINGNITGTGNLDIENKATLELVGTSTNTVTFEGGHGTLQIDSAGSSTAFSVTGGSLPKDDIIYLPNIAFDAASDSYDSSTHVLTVGDGHGHTVTIDVVGGIPAGHTFVFAQDGTGTEVHDPLVTDAPADATANPLSTATAQGTLTFADNDAATDLSVSVTPDGQNYVGNLTTGAVTESNGTAAVDYGFSLGNDQINVAPGQTVTQSYQVSLTDAQNPTANATQTVAVTIGGAGNDNFIFAPGVGHDTVLNFNAQQDTVELDHFNNAQTVQELQSLITADTHGNAVLDLGNHDSITFLNTTQAQLLQAVQNGHVLLH
jgi:hypothetical protein